MIHGKSDDRCLGSTNGIAGEETLLGVAGVGVCRRRRNPKMKTHPTTTPGCAGVRENGFLSRFKSCSIRGLCLCLCLFVPSPDLRDGPYSSTSFWSTAAATAGAGAAPDSVSFLSPMDCMYTCTLRDRYLNILVSFHDHSNFCVV